MSKGIVAVRLSELLAETGMDQSALARKIGATPSAVNQIVNGKTTKSRLLPEIASELGVSVKYLQGLTNQRTGDETELSDRDLRLLRAFRVLERDEQDAILVIACRLVPSAEIDESWVEGNRSFNSVAERPESSTVHDGRRKYRTE